MKSKSSQRITVLTFQDEKYQKNDAESGAALNDLETIKLLKMRRRIQVYKDGRDATPTTLTENDLNENNDRIKLNQNFTHEQQFENRLNVNVDADLNDIVNEVSCVFYFHLSFHLKLISNFCLSWKHSKLKILRLEKLLKRI